MKYLSKRLISLLFLPLALAGCASPDGPAHAISLAGVNGSRPGVGIPGRLDHMAYDPATGRLFAAALENGSLEVVDCQTHKRIASLTGLSRPQGVAIVTATGCVAAAGGGDGRLHVYDARTLREIKTVEVGPDADNVRYDAAQNTVLVCYGSSTNGAIASFDAAAWQKTGEFHFASKPESFQLDPDGKRLFANLPGGVRVEHDGIVCVVNRADGSVTEIQLKDRARNFPMALDAAHQRLFVASRRPARLIEIDLRNNTVAAEAPCAEDSDDLFYDAEKNHVLVIGGGRRPDMQSPGAIASVPAADETGAIDVFSVGSGGELRKIVSIPTRPHARTGMFVPTRRAIYVSVPPRDGRDSEILEYRVP